MKVFIAILICVLLAASILAPRELQAHLLAIQDFVEQHYVLSVLAFFGLYIISMLLIFFPVAVLTLLGGFLFGPIWGGIFTVVGSLLCALTTFIVSRYFMSHWVEQRAGMRLKLIMDGVTREGWRFVALVRLVPILPFHILNALLGLTRIRFWEYTFATFIFMLPVKLTYTYVGSLGEDFVRHPDQLPLTKLMLASSLMIVVGCLPWFLRRFRRRR
jgi:uncharacterized membrane protein YdjX (TVP38/TMEM64 family)